MKKLIKDAFMYIALGLVIWGIVAVFSVSKSTQVAKIAYKAFANAFWIIVSVFFFIGLIQAWVTPDQMSKYLGKTAGWKRFAFASTVPILLGGSLFTMLPLTKSLKEKGASNGAILAFLTAWSGKAPLIPLEAQFLGWKFTIIRTLLIIPTAIVIGIVGEVILDKWEGVPVKVDFGKMAEGEVLIGESIVEELNHEFNLRETEVKTIVSGAKHRVEFDILGDILEKNIPLKLAELASKYDYELVKL
ncbi:MAG: permease, partial [Caldisericum sp.]|uniref:permease n=1 Tax=Caldisericum sp. TaxID=2499687 RepID=UPI003D0D29C9